MFVKYTHSYKYIHIYACINIYLHMHMYIYTCICKAIEALAAAVCDFYSTFPTELASFSAQVV